MRKEVELQAEVVWEDDAAISLDASLGEGDGFSLRQDIYFSFTSLPDDVTKVKVERYELEHLHIELGKFLAEIPETPAVPF